MKTARFIMMLALGLLIPATQAFAESAARQDDSQFLVWAFLGMCALIVIVQLVPVAVVAFGLVKGLVSKGKEVPAHAEVAANK